MAAEVFEDVQRRHAELLLTMEGLDAAARGWAAAGQAGVDVRASLTGFLADCERRLLPLLEDEEERLFPLLDRCLSREHETSDALREEHETLRGLASLLRDQCRRMEAGQARDASAVLPLVQDLSALLHRHFRKEDQAFALLERLLREDNHA